MLKRDIDNFTGFIFQEEEKIFFHAQNNIFYFITGRVGILADILQKDNFGSDSLKVTTVNHMMMDGFNHPKFKRFNTVYEEADYLLTKSLSEGTVDTDLALIEKKLSQSLR